MELRERGRDEMDGWKTGDGGWREGGEERDRQGERERESTRDRALEI